MGIMKHISIFIALLLASSVTTAEETKNCEGRLSSQPILSFEIFSLPTEVLELRQQYIQLAMEVIEPGGPLEEYLSTRGKMDFATLKVYLFGSTANGISSNPHKKMGKLLNKNSDIDLFVSVYKIDGTPWERYQGSNKAFTYKGVPIEVISQHVPGGIDSDLQAMGIEVNLPPMSQEVPNGAILLRDSDY